MLENTRTTLTNRVVRFIAWNMPYHVEHHAYPSVPFHKLPEFHQHTQAHIKHLDEGYARFNRDFARSVIET
jgi:fatty acid desaturase